MATTDTMPFRLLDLPPELWSKIGKLVVDEEDDVTSLAVYEAGRLISKALRKPLKQPAITRTCKALRPETLPYYYRKKMSVNVVPGSIGSEAVGRWLRAIGPRNRSLIRGLRAAERVREGQDIKEVRESAISLLERGFKVDFEVIKYRRLAQKDDFLGELDILQMRLKMIHGGKEM